MMMEETMKTIDMRQTGVNIQRLMDKTNTTAQDIQVFCGFTTRNAVYKWLSGQSMPTIDNLVIIAQLFGVQLDDIVATH